VIQEKLTDREAKYGDFSKLAAAIQAFKNVYRASPSWPQLTAVQREVMEMNLVKTCRILYGDPQHEDSWEDLCGYAMLATEEFARSRAQKQTMEPPKQVEHPRDLDQAQ
jgi:hypothetical protein